MIKIKYIIASCLLIVLCNSCEDTVLNLDDPGQPTSATFFKTEAQLEVALAGIYESLNYVSVTPFPQVLDHATDLAFNRGNVAGTATATQGGLSSTDGLINGFWTSFYGGIQRANNLLSNMTKAEAVTVPTRFSEIKGEALFLRAFFYSYLIELYGDVPYRTDIVTSLLDEGLILPKTPKAEIAANIIADLEIAAGLLPATPAQQGRASGNAANALIARIALFNDNFTLAASKAQVVMISGLTLHPDYESLFLDANIGASEILLSMDYAVGTKVHQLSRRQGTRFGGWCQFVPVQQTVDSYETINGLPIDEDPAFDPANPFENRDPRLKATIVTPGDIWTNHTIIQHSDSIAVWKYNNGVKVERVFNPNSANPGGLKIIDPITNVEYTTGGANRFTSFTGYFWKKFSDEPNLKLELVNNPSNSEQPIILMRYAEVLLNYAEAKIEDNKIDQTVLDAINEVRERAYKGSGIPYPAITTMDQGALRKIVRRERKVEFADEGLRLFDIRRWKIAEKVMNGIAVGGPANGFSKIGGDLGLKPDIDDDGHVTYPGAPIDPRAEKGNLHYRNLETRVFNPIRDYLWPIPQAEIDATDGVVTPNPGY
jgi:hypothetical protein